MTRAGRWWLAGGCLGLCTVPALFGAALAAVILADLRIDRYLHWFPGTADDRAFLGLGVAAIVLGVPLGLVITGGFGMLGPALRGHAAPARVLGGVALAIPTALVSGTASFAGTLVLAYLGYRVGGLPLRGDDVLPAAAALGGVVGVVTGAAVAVVTPLLLATGEHEPEEPEF